MSSHPSRRRNFFSYNRKNAKSRQARRHTRAPWLGAGLTLERLESRFALSANPILTVVPNQSTNEASNISITNIGTFTDVVEGSGSAAIGLNPMDFAATTAFDPIASVHFDTDALTYSGGASGSGTFVTENIGYGDYEIAVFVFTDFELDAGLTITASGSRPLALLSQSDMTIVGTINVGATLDPSTANGNNRFAGPGGGDGGEGAFSGTFTPPPFNSGEAAAGAPANSVGNPYPDVFAGFPGGGGTGAGHGGKGGRAEGQQGTLGGVVGVAYANLALGITGGSGGGTSGGENIALNSHWVAGGGGGGGGIELGAVNTLEVATGGQVLANGGEGAMGINLVGVGSGGGGAGGGILLHATNVNQFGSLSANGGNGGTNGEKSGGGGAGGAIMIVYSPAGAFDNTGGTQSAVGGQPWFNGSLGGEAGFAGTIDVVTGGAAAPIIESYDYVIDWGDGSADSTGPATIDVPGSNVGDTVQGSFDGSHTYADNGTYTVTVTINDNNGGTDTDTFTITVNNVEPDVAISGASTVNEGALYTLTLSADNDPGPDTISEWEVNWGDGNVETIMGNPSSATHVYADGNANYTISAEATDEDGTYAAAATVALMVMNVAPALALSGASNTNEGQLYTLNLSSNDPGADTITSWTINWGDGNVQTVAGNPSSATHVYVDGNSTSNYTISATATDEDGTFAAGNTVAVHVNNLAPTADAGGPYLALDEMPITLNGSGTDPAGAADPLTFAWDLDGDGIFGETGSGATRGNETGANPTMNTAGLSGVVTVTLRVSDGDGGVTTDTAQVFTSGVFLIDGTLWVVGTNDCDIALISKCGSQIVVLASFNSTNPTTYNSADVNDIQVRLKGGHDILITTSNVTQSMTIDGGTGNDLLTGGGGRNLIYGGDGHDILYGDGGDDVLFGGAGNDDLIGGGGNDVLVGGSGCDILCGGAGRDLLIGGQDNDSIEGGDGEDILIGGYTVHDNSVAALDSVMAIWKSSASFDARVATLTGTNGLLKAGVKVFDDDDSDDLSGDAGRDLYFGDTSKSGDGVKDDIDINSAQDKLIALN